ncbi:ABC transporter permease [Phyllobacterium myrsinacearum]|uniref:Peptide/nickel transport system permease protein n=1 Tax=Phyllobacterium myrsinacearum TaxID=28101 RepID=A0A839ES16_9HYPH|nr:ABC transporter permease [Phyllobacterium myrsinacearum]MBA8880988.1 peptide/nickel transport system permease protein [Phyllobacterium myrsinacearum]
MGSIMNMLGRRLILSFAILSLTSLIVFLGTEVLPGDAITATIPAEELAFYTPEQLADLRKEYGLDRPLPVRFLEVWERLFTFDFGTTLIKKEPVLDHIAHPMINSGILAGLAMLVMLGLVLVLGILASLKPGGRLDTAISATTLFTYSMPDFVVGNVFVVIFAVWLGLTPAVIFAPTNAPKLTILLASLLPVAALCIHGAAYQFRLLRAGMVEALNSDYVERARLAGLPTWYICIRHALPVAMIPMLNGTAQFVAGLLSGSVVVETVFKYPGVGSELLRALAQREIPTIQAIAFLAALAVVTANFIADLAILGLDPRVRASAQHG